MYPQEKKRILTEYMQLKLEQADWHGVADVAMDLREIEVEIRLTKTQGVSSGQKARRTTKAKRPAETASSVQPTQGELTVTHQQAPAPAIDKIPHQISEVQKILKLSDEELVERLFPMEAVGE